ncbi:MAG: IS3 family transposase, partial [bacterium]|nr:IS3 family transposase [bacterium]
NQLYAEACEGKVIRSMSGSGNCYDNAMAESFFATLKLEAVHGLVFATRSEARMATFDYIEVFYNRQRLHSGIAYAAPVTRAA